MGSGLRETGERCLQPRDLVQMEECARLAARAESGYQEKQASDTSPAVLLCPQTYCTQAKCTATECVICLMTHLEIDTSFLRTRELRKRKIISP